MKTLDIFKQDLLMKARKLPDFDDSKIEKDKITAWANAYCEACDNNDGEKKDLYISALMLKFWYQIPDMYEKTKTCGKYDYEDYSSILFDCINTACSKEHRAWQKDKKLSAQSCINQVIATRGVAQIMYESNLAKNQANVPANQIYLDATVGGDDDMLVSDSFGKEDEALNYSPKGLIQHFIDNNKIIEAIILDNIAFDNCMRTKSTKKTYVDEDGKESSYKVETNEFYVRQCVQSLVHLPTNYLDYFKKSYTIETKKLSAALDRIKSSNTTKLNKFLVKTLDSAKEELTCI